MDRLVQLTRERIQPEAVRLELEAPGLGGIAIFLGEVRAVTAGCATRALLYEAYEEMALLQLNDLVEAALRKWPGKVALLHRLGELRPGDIAVLAAAACPHRAEAFESCRFLIEGVKADVAIWKSEAGADAAGEATAK